jgi:hypothetical protein
VLPFCGCADFVVSAFTEALGQTIMPQMLQSMANIANAAFTPSAATAFASVLGPSTRFGVCASGC